MTTAGGHDDEATRQVVVAGAGMAGLATALFLGRAGHRVTLLERDATPVPASAAAAFAWDRRGAPQVRHSHAFLARMRTVLRDRAPDVLEALLDAGATEIRFVDMLPPEMTDRDPRPGDEDLVALACRRTTFEWVLRRAVLDAPGVELVDGAAVAGLQGTPATQGSPARVSGVDVTRGSETLTLDADLVVAANGRRSPVPGWLSALGAAVDETEDDTGIVYFSRFYGLRDGVDPPDTTGPIGGDLGYLKYAVFQGDNRTFSVTFAVVTSDEELRSRLLDPDVFDRAARHLPATQAWAEPGLADPLTDVEVMARLVNRLRRFTVDGAPVALGFAAVGDAHTCTNPLYGRGCSLAAVQADLLTDALAAHGWSGAAALVDYEAASAREVEPWYHASVISDRQAKALATRLRRERRGEDTADLDGDPDATMGDLIRFGMLPAMRTDPDVFRAFLRMFNLLDAPDRLMTDPDLMTKVLQSYAAREERPPEEPLGPSRTEMLAALTEA